MTYAGWIGVWNSAVAQIGHAPFVVQLAVWLGLVFAVTMCLEGMRVSLLPRRWLAARMARSPFSIPAESERALPVPAIVTGVARSPDATEKPSRRTGNHVPPVKRDHRTRKKVIMVKRRTKPIKPKITRYPADPVPPPIELMPFATSDIASEPMQEFSASL